MPVIIPSGDIINDECDTRRDLLQFDAGNLWTVVYERLKNRSTLLNEDVTCDTARDAENRWKNRYRDISPYDDTRVVLKTLSDGDYINANFVEVPDVSTRRYILTQGPMQHTVSHFWLMIWEQRCPAIVMLSRIFEKGTMRCFPYFPSTDNSSSCLNFVDVDLTVRLVQESDMQLFIKRVFEVTHMKTSEVHTVIQLHYTNWPDFGVPKSPSGLLNFLWAVRGTGVLSDRDHPAVIHCSAGVGRSGAFVLIDLALYLTELRGTLNGLDMFALFLNLRRCRMGIIQTADQLRFCYSAVVRGADQLVNTPPDKIPFIKFERHSYEIEEDSVGSSGENADDWGDSSEADEDGDYNSSAEDEDSDQVEDELDLVDQEEEGEQQQDEGNGDQKKAMANPQTESKLRHRPTRSAELRWLNEDEPDYTVIDKVATIHPRHTGVFSPIGSSVYEQQDPAARTIMNDSECTPGTNILDADEEANRADSFFIHRAWPIDRSNNAVPAHMEQNTHPIMATAIPTPENIQDTNLVSQPDGDTVVTATSDQTQQQQEPTTLSPAPRIRTINPLHNLEISEADYAEAAYEIHRRHVIRKERQLRTRNRVEQIQRRMREADMERKRWIPPAIARHLRRFYGESGLIRSTTGAVVSTVVIALSAVAFAVASYRYWST